MGPVRTYVAPFVERAFASTDQGNGNPRAVISLHAALAACAVALRRLLRLHDNGLGAIRHRSIRMRNDRHGRHSGGECEGQGENYSYLLHDRVPLFQRPKDARTGKLVQLISNVAPADSPCKLSPTVTEMTDAFNV